MNRTHCIIHITRMFGGSRDLDPMNIIHVFIHRIARFGSSKVMDHK